MTHREPELLIATRNEGKARELAAMLRGSRLRVRSLAEFPQAPEVEETGLTFAENAALKARAYADATGLWTLADDSGLEVAALGGEPGVRSARYGGLATDAERTARLLEELARTNDAERRARFVCVIALALPPSDRLHFFEGTCEGRIARAPAGSHGFGYDPVFCPDGYEQTFGQLPDETKEQLSHRARALARALAFLNRLLRPTT
ncbi:MAG TPA: RdgB/HAM1 family non-canonical purine NTP pyrophosphatase [Pyrinomonadaceae bacterium]|nr:RdgB/HAM1 family non-canonical purine NTP pyrophosphatase [Pyrinomonadaceae bacterium]